MLTQPELIDAARAAIAKREGRAEPVTHYRVSKELGITSAYMTKLRAGENIMSSDIAVKLGELADLPLTYVAACIEHERAQRSGNAETSGVWKAIADMVIGKAASILLALVAVGTLIGAPQPASAQGFATALPDLAAANTVYYVKLLMRLLSRWFRRTVTGALPARPALAL